MQLIKKVTVERERKKLLEIVAHFLTGIKSTVFQREANHTYTHTFQSW
jgi:hypothetical protein